MSNRAQMQSLNGLDHQLIRQQVNNAFTQPIIYQDAINLSVQHANGSNSNPVLNPQIIYHRPEPNDNKKINVPLIEGNNVSKTLYYPNEVQPKIKTNKKKPKYAPIKIIIKIGKGIYKIIKNFASYTSSNK